MATMAVWKPGLTWRKCKTEVTMSWYLMKIIGTHLEIIKDGGIVFGLFSRLSGILTRLQF